MVKGKTPQLPEWLALGKVLGTVTVSSVFKDMIYVIVAIFVFIAVLVFIKAPAWIILMAFGILICTLFFFMRWYNETLEKNPESLRSEKYQIEKTRLEMMGTKAKEQPAQVIEGEAIIEKPKEKNQPKKVVNKLGGKK